MDLKGCPKQTVFTRLGGAFCNCTSCGKSFYKNCFNFSQENPEAVNSSPVLLSKDTLVKPAIQKESSEKRFFQKIRYRTPQMKMMRRFRIKLDRDRQAQKQTKYFKNKARTNQS